MLDFSCCLILMYWYLSLDAGSVLLTLDECGVHDVTGVLKQYLRQLPDPVIPGTMYKHFIAAGCNHQFFVGGGGAGGERDGVERVVGILNEISLDRLITALCVGSTKLALLFHDPSDVLITSWLYHTLHDFYGCCAFHCSHIFPRLTFFPARLQCPRQVLLFFRIL